MNNKEKKIEHLGNGINIFISKKYSFTTDSIILAKFSSPKRSDIAVELGTGCGIIPFIWCRDNLASHIKAIEIQREAYQMVKESVKLNKLENKLSVLNSDIKDKKFLNSLGKANIVVCNPPYKQTSCGKISANQSRNTARNECTCDLSDILQAADILLNNGGYLCMCYRCERLCEVLSKMHNIGIEPKVIKFIHYKQGNPSQLFLIRGKKGASSGIICESPLVISDLEGNYTEEVKKIYKAYSH